MNALRPHLVENGGVVRAEHISFVEGRGNLMLEYCPDGASGMSAKYSLLCVALKEHKQRILGAVQYHKQIISYMKT